MIRIIILNLILLLCNIIVIESKFSGWVDPDTKPIDSTRVSYTDGKVYDIIMSDEFNKAGRSFKDGDDPVWTGIDKSDDDQTSSGRKSLEFYNSSQLITEQGKLVILTTTEDTKWKGFNPYKKQYETMTRHFKSGMIQSWDKFCYTGGILEIDVQFPGRHDIGGLWPAVWLMGNLGRATFEASTNLLWPWSYDECDRDLQTAQEISACDITSHFSLQPGKGRGATEMDIIEVMPGPSTKLPIVKNNVRRPYSSMTLQVAPGLPADKRRPPTGTLPEWGFNWYHNISYGKNVSINPFFYGTYLASTKKDEPSYRSPAESYQCDAISSMMAISKDYFEKMHTFRFEWQPGTDGYVHWYVDGELKFGVEQESLNIMKTKIPNEPSYIIMNTAISTSWGFPNPPVGCTEYDCKNPEEQCGFNPGFCKSLPAKFYIDSVRVYQNKNDSRQTIGCNPKDYPTKRWIKGHEYRYKRAIDVKPLKDIIVGGDKCSNSTVCGNGYCAFGKCKCTGEWIGPKCLSPPYKNDFPDWDEEAWMVLDGPYIPSFLVICALLFASIVIGGGILLVIRRRQSRVEAASGLFLYEYDKAPSWL